MRKEINYYKNNWDALGGSLKWENLTDEQRNRSIDELDRLEADLEARKSKLAELTEKHQRLEIEHAVMQERLRVVQGQHPSSASKKLF